jgi:peptide deformylase
MKRWYAFSSFLMILLAVAGCSGAKQIALTKTSATSFLEAESALIMQRDSLTPMRVLHTTNASDSSMLRTVSRDVNVNPDDLVLRHFISRLYSTVRDSLSLGVGIAAPQVGVMKNIIWVQRFDKPDTPFEVYLNPKILQYSQLRQECREGCLSVPGRSDTLEVRSYAVLVEYETLDQQRRIEMIEDFTAVIFQHEIDHLNGILYTDYVEKKSTNLNHE